MEEQDIKDLRDDSPLELVDIEALKDIRKYGFVSQRAVDNNHIGYCYRDYPETNIDSGWHFIYGDEDEEYLDDSENCLSIFPEDMLSINPELADILESTPNKEFEWDIESKKYREITNQD
ncbi:hypothetical protein AwDysgo_12420 [Bacteroidales bacterium]|nr:hypothetical protein AwDysgo_12420 [Bacteroidales bacterium]